MKKILSFCLILFLLQGCSCGCNSKKLADYKVALDPEFFPVNFKNKEPYVLGYTEELLLEFCKISNISLDLISTNWDSLFLDLKKGNYNGVISSFPPYDFNKAKYDFSESYFDFGPILIVPKNSTKENLLEFNGKIIGVLDGSSAVNSIQKVPDVLIRSYPSNLEIFTRLSAGDIDAGAIDKIDAISYIGEFKDTLKIIGNPLTDEGLRLIVMKDQNPSLLRDFNKALIKLKKDSKYTALLEKWDLNIPES